MGLDMYVCEIDKKDVQLNDEFLILNEDKIDIFKKEEFFYWRKHPNLHGWFNMLYNSRGGIEFDFNNIPVLIREEDVIKLKEDMSDDLLPKTSGFFFGESDKGKEERTKDFVKKALDFYKKNKDSYLIYTSSW